MTRHLTWVVLLLGACGPTPAEVGGSFSGQHSLAITPGGAEHGSEIITIDQRGGQISFTLSLCQLKAHADTNSTFKVEKFKCSRSVSSAVWELESDENGKVTSNANNLSISISGNAKNGSVVSPFTWSYNGSRR